MLRWLSTEIFEWHRRVESFQEFDTRACRRAYAHIEHAQKLLSFPDGDDLLLGNVVGTLKRCLNCRLQQLEGIYHFRDAPLGSTHKGLLDRMAALGVVRPMLLKHLLEVRNAVEHQDAPPPSRSRCEELLDVMWHFLRSTDEMTARSADGYYLEQEAGVTPAVEFSITVGHAPWRVLAHLSVPQGLLSLEEMRGWIKLDIVEQETYKSLRWPDQARPGSSSAGPCVVDQNPHLFARVDGPDTALQEILKTWFRPWWA